MPSEHNLNVHNNILTINCNFLFHWQNWGFWIIEVVINSIQLMGPVEKANNYTNLIIYFTVKGSWLQKPFENLALQWNQVIYVWVFDWVQVCAISKQVILKMNMTVCDGKWSLASLFCDAVVDYFCS